jgi:hypothetical protein
MTGVLNSATARDDNNIIRGENGSETVATPGPLVQKGEKKPEEVATEVISAPDKANTETSATKVKKATVRKNRVYAGIVAGPDISTTKLSKAKGVGYSAGLLIGYKVSNKFSLETGLMWDRKRYQATGKDFNTKKLNWPPHTNLLEISGYCDMFEIPLAVRYDLTSGQANKWFIKAGSSSYLMKKEDYQYKTERYGVYYNGNRTYEKFL